MPRHAKPRQTLAEWFGFTPEPPTLVAVSLGSGIEPSDFVPSPAVPFRGPSPASRPADPRILRGMDGPTEPVAGRPEWADVAESAVVERLQLLAERSQTGHPEGVFVWDEFTHAMETGQTGTQWRAFQAGLRAAAKWAARS